jgi:predicted outer membrane protein
MWTRRSALTTILVLASGHALGQTDLTPDPTPRLPPQPGQGLPVEDQAFLLRAANLSSAEIEAGARGAEKATDPDVQQISQELEAFHQKLLESLREFGADDQPASGEAAPVKSWSAELQQLSGLGGEEFDRELLAWQLRAHTALARLYQVQASNTPESELAKFAILSFEQIQRQFGRLRELGAKYGLHVDRVGQPPQY